MYFIDRCLPPFVGDPNKPGDKCKIPRGNFIRNENCFKFTICNYRLGKHYVQE